MPDGTRGGSTDTALDNIVTDEITSGAFTGMKAQAVKLLVGGNGAATLVDAANGVPVTLDAASLAALETIGLDASTLAALETINVGNLPADFPDAATLAKLELIRLLLAGTLTIGGTVTANVGTGTQPVSGTVGVSNFPATQPISAAALPLPSGAATEATLDARTGALTEGAPANDTASSGLNGRLQRIAQRLTSLIGLLPPALGAGGGLKVDGSGTALPVSNASLPLPTGASTSAKQPALGTAGAASADVITVQGIAAGTPVPIVGKQTRISVIPTVSTSPAYTAKDAVGGLLTFANAARVSGGTITIQSVVIIDNSQQRPALDLVLFDRTFAASTDNAIFAPSDADLVNVIGVIPIAAWSDFSTNSVATRFGLGFAAKLAGTDLFGQLVTAGAMTFVATTDITVILEVIQD